MKLQKKNSERFYSRLTNNRWKWMAAATAATAVGVTSSQASTITINLVNNYISPFFVNHLNADLTGDGHPDLTVANVRAYTNYVSVRLNGVRAFCGYDVLSYQFRGLVKLDSRSASFYSYRGIHFGTYSLMGSIPIFFKDLHINGGAPTSGSLEVTVTPRKIQLDSLSYNTPDQRLTRAVPDQGSSLSLLAMGAAGILAFRRWRAAPAQS